MAIKTDEHPQRAFGPAQLAAFAPLVPALEAFAQEHGLAQTFDTDPACPCACYFVLWPRERCRPCNIRVMASDPFAVCTGFRIDGTSRRRVVFGRTYDSSEGGGRLKAVLEEARQAIERDNTEAAASAA